MTDEPEVIQRLRENKELYLIDGEPTFFGVHVEEVLAAYDALRAHVSAIHSEREKLRNNLTGVLGKNADLYVALYPVQCMAEDAMRIAKYDDPADIPLSEWDSFTASAQAYASRIEFQP